MVIYPIPYIFPSGQKKYCWWKKKTPESRLLSQSVSQPSAHFNKQLQGLFLHVCVLVCVDVHAH